MAQQVPLKIYKTTVNGVTSYAILPGYNTPSGYQETTAADLKQNATPQNQNQIVGDLKNAFKLDVTSIDDALTKSSGYVIDDKGRFIKQSASDQEQALANDPNQTNIGTADRPLYIPKGSAADVALKNPASLNTATQNSAPTPSGSTQGVQTSASAGSSLSAAPASTGVGGGGSAEALIQVYLKRPDLQELYNPDGSAKNPNDPRIAGIPTLNDWSAKFGVKEEPTLASAAQSSGVQSTGDPHYDALLTHLQPYLDQLLKNGQVINPNVQITPDQLAAFTAQAVTQIHPYFATQLKAATDSFLTGLGYNTQQLNNQVQQAQSQYGRTLDNQSSSFADQGFAQSGIRMKAQNELATDTQKSLDQARGSLINSSTNQAQSFAQQYGGAQVPQAPQLGQAPRVLAGQSQFDTSGGNTGLYQLNPDIYNKLIGSEQNSEKQATDTLSSQLASNAQQLNANSQTRSLNLTT